MSWSCIGEVPYSSEVADKLNNLNIGTSATVSVNAARDRFVVWVHSDSKGDGTKTWKALVEKSSQEEIATVMKEHNLAPNCAIVSVDANNLWQLWGYV